jgi:uncharacterized protein YjiS (DUF1127 family)
MAPALVHGLLPRRLERIFPPSQRGRNRPNRLGARHAGVKEILIMNTLITAMGNTTRAGAMLSVLGGITGGVAGITSRWNDSAERRRVAAQLAALTDRELSDIGLNRADIPVVTMWGSDTDAALRDSRRPF